MKGPLVSSAGILQIFASLINSQLPFFFFAETVPAEGTMFDSPTFKILDFLFGIPIIHDIMFGVYRKQIVEKSGIDIILA